MKKKIAFLLAILFGVSCLTACVDSGADGVDDGSVSVEAVEDVEISYGTVTLINLTGKDAVELYARESGTTEWSKTILSQDFLKANVETKLTYTYTKNNINVFDVRLVFEDGTEYVIENRDFLADSGRIFIGS